MMTNPRFFGIKKVKGESQPVPDAASALPLGGTHIAVPGVYLRPQRAAASKRPVPAAPPSAPVPPVLSALLAASGRMPCGGAKGVLQASLRVEAAARPSAFAPTVPRVSPAEFARRAPNGTYSKPPPTGFAKPRASPPNSLLRLMYERGDVPCIVTNKGSNATLKWNTPVEGLDYALFLPALCSGLREMEWPLPLLAAEGIKDLAAASPDKVAAVVHMCVPALREALNTRRNPIVVRTLVAIETLVECDLPPGKPAGATSRIAVALVPYFRQLLPVCNIFAGKNINTGDVPDYGQRKNRIIGERVDALLRLLETRGGPNALPNIRYLVPTHAKLV